MRSILFLLSLVLFLGVTACKKRSGRTSGIASTHTQVALSSLLGPCNFKNVEQTINPGTDLGENTKFRRGMIWLLESDQVREFCKNHSQSFKRFNFKFHSSNTIEGDDMWTFPPNTPALSNSARFVMDFISPSAQEINGTFVINDFYLGKKFNESPEVAIEEFLQFLLLIEKFGKQIDTLFEIRARWGLAVQVGGTNTHCVNNYYEPFWRRLPINLTIGNVGDDYLKNFSQVVDAWTQALQDLEEAAERNKEVKKIVYAIVGKSNRNKKDFVESNYKMECIDGYSHDQTPYGPIKRVFPYESIVTLILKF